MLSIKREERLNRVCSQSRVDGCACGTIFIFRKGLCQRIVHVYRECCYFHALLDSRIYIFYKLKFFLIHEVENYIIRNKGLIQPSPLLSIVYDLYQFNFSNFDGDTFTSKWEIKPLWSSPSRHEKPKLGSCGTSSISTDDFIDLKLSKRKRYPADIKEASISGRLSLSAGNDDIFRN